MNSEGTTRRNETSLKTTGNATVIHAADQDAPLRSKSQETIFISAYRNASVRYILYSEILAQLRQHGIRIVVFVPDGDVDFFRERLNYENVLVEPIHSKAAMMQLKSGFASRFFVLVRKFMSGGEGENRNTTDDMMVLRYKSEMTSSLSRRILFSSAVLTAYVARKLKWLRRGIVKIEGLIYPGKIYDHYFLHYRPKLFVVSSLGYMIDPYFMRAARRNGVKIVSIIHSWDNPTAKDYAGARPDYVITWNDIMTQEVALFHDFPKERIFTGGIAHWDFYFSGRYPKQSKQDFLVTFGFSEDRKVIYYGTSSCVLFKKTFDVIERILEAIEHDSFCEPAQLLVRLHPSYMTHDKRQGGILLDRYRARIDKINQRFGDLVSFDVPDVLLLSEDGHWSMEDMYRQANNMKNADVMLTEYSTLMIEAAIYDLPIINVGLYDYRDNSNPQFLLVENFTHIKRILRTEACRNAHNYDELFEYINHYLKCPSCDNDKRKALVRQEVTHNPGTAGQAIANYLLSLV